MLSVNVSSYHKRAETFFGCEADVITAQEANISQATAHRANTIATMELGRATAGKLESQKARSRLDTMRRTNQKGRRAVSVGGSHVAMVTKLAAIEPGRSTEQSQHLHDSGRWMRRAFVVKDSQNGGGINNTLFRIVSFYGSGTRQWQLEHAQTTIAQASLRGGGTAGTSTSPDRDGRELTRQSNTRLQRECGLIKLP